MAYLGQPFPRLALGRGKTLRQHSLGIFTSQGANALYQSAKDLVLNSLPPSWGGQALTQNQLDAINEQIDAAIDVASGGNAALAAAAKAQAHAEIAAVASEANNPPGSTSWADWLGNNWPWVLLAGGATYYALA